MVSLRFKKAFCVMYSGLLFVSGIVLIVVSSVLLYRVFHHFDYIPGSTVGPLILLIILGFGHIFLTWLGIKGPTLEHTFHIILFIVFTSILLITEFIIGVWTMILRDGAPTHSVDLMTEAFNEMIKEQYYNKDFARMQAEIECCGLDGAANYANYFRTDDAIRLSYMSCKDSNVPNNNVDFEPYPDGCQDAFPDYLQLLLLEAALMGFICTGLQAFGLYVICSFNRSLKEERSRRARQRAELQRQLSAQSQQSHTLLPQPEIGEVGLVPPPIGISHLASSPEQEPMRPPRERATAPQPPAPADPEKV
ncbi:uncharacterized protein LOC126882910 [Diabrotica virgifera virgifera]|uniref:Tetraspanin n=1 Tax=Diabrotica virgifera virgifera TaxID=50390 RepID=A0ABM5K179_DIAVI|nr:uncharacterized protein LOC126882910 [Diabrotica virgifera virgifera]